MNFKPDLDRTKSKQKRSYLARDLVQVCIPRELHTRIKKASRLKLETLTAYLTQALEERLKADKDEVQK